MDIDTVKRERCPRCAHDAFRNNFLLRSGHHARVFVECAACGAFVARYILHAYVDPSFDFAASLERLRHLGDDESVRHVVDEMAIHQRRAREQFDEVKRRLDAMPPSEEPLLTLIRRGGVLEDG
jgi:hypothetical protein